MKSFLNVAPEVREALKCGNPVVALESTIISHGMPYPQNIETARLLEKTVRENGAIPATIAILNGKICVGLDDQKIELLGTSKEIFKASRRDIPELLAFDKSAATTVSATMICARLAGVKFFATGGIGGVHRGAGESFDISADLEELAKTPVLVVCAGAKAVLDIPATLEYLETKGVPFLSYGCDQVPAFYYPDSGCAASCRIDKAVDAAKIFAIAMKLGYNSGVLVGNPVDKKFAMDRSEIEHVFQRLCLTLREKKLPVRR
jgi:pseudouridine-5'-phosphate glycosidase